MVIWKVQKGYIPGELTKKLISSVIVLLVFLSAVCDGINAVGCY